MKIVILIKKFLSFLLTDHIINEYGYLEIESDYIDRICKKLK